MKSQKGNTIDTQIVPLREFWHIHPTIYHALTELVVFEQAGVLVTSYGKSFKRVRWVLTSVITMLAVG